MEKAFWGIMGALTITFLALLGIYLYNTGAFSKEEEAVVQEENTQEITNDLDDFLQESHEKYGDAMKALEDDREPIRQQESPYDKFQDTTTVPPVISYEKPSGEIATNRNDGYDNFLEEKETSKEEDTDEEKKEDEKGKSVKTDEWEYTLYSDHVVVTKYLGNAINLSIPEKFDKQPVTEIGDAVFAKNIKLVNIVFPNSVKKLGSGVLKECTSLVDVTLPTALSEIGKENFMGCTNLVRISLPKSLKVLSESTFENCTYLSKVSFADDITSIEKNCFRNCISLNSVSLGNKLTKLGEGAFSGCIAISEIEIPKTLDVIGASCFDGCQGLLEVTFQKKSVLSIIGDMAFQNCSLIETILLPSKLTAIGEKAFTGCSALKEVSIPKTVISIKGEAFSGTAIEEITVNKSCVINDTAFPSGIEKYYY